MLLALVASGYWRRFPALLAWAAASALINAIPRDINNPAWWSGPRASNEFVMLALLIVAIGEASVRAIRGVLGAAIKPLLLALSGALVMGASVAWSINPHWSKFHREIAIREYVQIGLALWLIVLALFLWAIQHSRTLEFRSLLILCWFVTGQAIIRILDPHTGSAALPDSFWGIADAAAYLNATACCVAWTILMYFSRGPDARTKAQAPGPA